MPRDNVKHKWPVEAATDFLLGTCRSVPKSHQHAAVWGIAMSSAMDREAVFIVQSDVAYGSITRITEVLTKI